MFCTDETEEIQEEMKRRATIIIVLVVVITLGLIYLKYFNNPYAGWTTIDNLAKTVTFRFDGKLYTYKLGDPAVGLEANGYTLEVVTVGYTVEITLLRKGRVVSHESMRVA